jgi:peptidoglycan/LPS O-acetylase OafA/YrhL
MVVPGLRSIVAALWEPLVNTRPRGKSYRPEIDGLRALAVLAVILNHLNTAWAPTGFLGVDIFFVISGYVVTSSLLARQPVGPLAFLGSFYGRRFKRLLPALITMVVLVSILFSILVSGNEDLFPPSLRTGLAALFGVSNLYLLKQGAGYFAADTSFQPFLHTWSLGVEEQFYFVWPLLLLGCRLGSDGHGHRYRRRLAILTLVLFMASLGAYVLFSVQGKVDQAFYLMTSRFWELSLGCLAYLLHRGGGGPRDSGIRLTWENHRPSWATAILLATSLLLIVPLPWAFGGNIAITVLTALLLVLLQPRRGLAAKLLGHPGVVSVGLLSYSLYLWHWPLIVLARWTVGINRLTLLPILALILVFSLLSYRLELFFRYHSTPSAWPFKPWLVFPFFSLVAAAVVGGLQGPLRGWLFSGLKGDTVTVISNNKKIPGTSINTANCFLEPTAPIAPQSAASRCSATSDPRRPTLYFEGDSHSHALMPLAGKILASGSHNISLLARGGCLAPYFSPWPGGRDKQDRYKLCEQYFASRVAALKAAVKPGDSVVVVSFIRGPLESSASELSYRKAVLDLARDLGSRKVRLVLFAPLPMFEASDKRDTPSSLCQVEWFRPAWSLSTSCRTFTVSRKSELLRTESFRRLLYQLSSESPLVEVFDPFPVVCPENRELCASKSDGQILFQDSHHLSDRGALLLYPSFRDFLASLEAQSR